MKLRSNVRRPGTALSSRGVRGSLLAALLLVASLPVAPVTGATTITLVGAGDIASCGTRTDEQTAALVAAIPGTAFTAGDNVYSDGTSVEFRDCYDPSWGAFKDRTRPAPGNHDYHTAGASGLTLLVALLASTCAAWRVTQIDPAEALRDE